MRLYVSYSWANGSQHGFGAAGLDNVRSEPTCYEDVVVLADRISSSEPGGLGKVIIINWRQYAPA